LTAKPDTAMGRNQFICEIEYYLNGFKKLDKCGKKCVYKSRNKLRLIAELNKK